MVRRAELPLVLGLALVVGLLAGCQMMARGPSNEEQIQSLIDTFVDAGNKGEIEAVMSCFAEDFETEDGADKETIRFMLEDGIASGIEFGASDMKINIAEDGKSAEVEGVEIDYTPYIATVEKRAGKWLIVSGEEQY